MEFLTPYRETPELNKVERWKLERHPLDVHRAVIEHYSKEGISAIAAVEGEQERLKWVGIYPQRTGGDAFMMRVKVPGGRLTAAQARAVGEISETFGRSAAGNSHSEGCCDLTTRQDIQLHWVHIGDVPEIWRRLEHVGITTLQACGDSARNVLCCPVAGIDADEAFDALPVAQAISDFFTGNREYANLPRKFKISATGCLDDCAQAEINDVGLRPARDHHGELGFNVVVGGGLSDGPRLASDIDVFVGLDQAVELTRAIAQTWGELGNRENRGQSRMRYLVQELGPERFREELAVRCSFALTLAGTSLTRRYRGDHVGVHRQRQAGLSYVGLNVTVGRIQGTALMEAARLAETYGDGGIRLATDQNLIVTGVGDAALPDLLAEPLLRVHSPNPGPFERGAVACTGTEYCRFAIVETKQRMASWARELDRSFPPLGGDRGIVRIHLSGCSASCAQPQIADIGLRGDIADKDGRMVEALDIGLGGSLGTDAAFIDWVEGAKPADEVPGSLTRLLVAYQAQANPGERFYEWARRVPNGDLRGLIAEVSS